MQNQGIKYGVIGGIGIILYMLLFFIIDKEMMLSPWVYWAGMIVYITAMFAAIFASKKAKDGEITAQEGMKEAFTCFLIANLFFYIFYMVLFNWISPEMADLQKDMSLELLKSTESFYPPEKFVEMKKDMESADFKVTLGGSVFGLAKGAIGGFVLSFLMGRMIRNK